MGTGMAVGPGRLWGRGGYGVGCRNGVVMGSGMAVGTQGGHKNRVAVGRLWGRSGHGGRTAIGPGRLWGRGAYGAVPVMGPFRLWGRSGYGAAPPSPPALGSRRFPPTARNTAQRKRSAARAGLQERGGGPKAATAAMGRERPDLGAPHSHPITAP